MILLRWDYVIVLHLQLASGINPITIHDRNQWYLLKKNIRWPLSSISSHVLFAEFLLELIKNQ